MTGMSMQRKRRDQEGRRVEKNLREKGNEITHEMRKEKIIETREEGKRRKEKKEKRRRAQKKDKRKKGKRRRKGQECDKDAIERMEEMKLRRGKIL